MALKSVPEETIDYIPAYGGNRDDKDPTWVRIQPMNRKEADIYRKQIEFKDRGGGFRGQGRLRSNVNEVQRSQFVDKVLEIHNFLDYKTGKEITDVKEFYDIAPDDLVEEIFNAILNASQLGEDEVKNSDSQSAGSSKGKAGTAETAKDTKEETETVQ